MDFFDELRIEVTKQVIETEDAFIIRTLYPYCHDILETKISKKILEKALYYFKTEHNAEYEHLVKQLEKEE
ncbi:MAG: hypothetical protein VZR54_08995 [Ruminococcus sp.]|nr:hypothetical protein [Ruminococcus sp.]